MSSYEKWSKEDLIKRIKGLERSKRRWDVRANAKQNTVSAGTLKKILAEKYDFSAHPKRKIALKFCYSGWEYNGLAAQATDTPLPTVEDVLFNAMTVARLVDPEAGFEGCGWEKCGRTDAGVSAAGQVISLWVRSVLGTSRPATSSEKCAPSSTTDLSDDPSPSLEGELGSLDLDDEDIAPRPLPTSNVNHDGKHELDYVSNLNRILPPTIRVIAWSPVSDEFSARYHCKFRYYKYFFSDTGLDIARMQSAAKRFVGDHDFRNFCKLDKTKQITIFDRKIFSAEVEPLASGSGMYVFNLIGRAFLYHQVRHIMAILFLVGKGLEDESLITTMFNTRPGLEGDVSLEVVNGRPNYQMADALPLMLWDCAYDESEVNWRGVNEDKELTRGIYSQLKSIWERSNVTSALNEHLLMATEQLHLPRGPAPRETEVPLGGGTYRAATQYLPVLRRERLDTVENRNEKWKVGKERKLALQNEQDDGDE